jgi:hypothetical protein
MGLRAKQPVPALYLALQERRAVLDIVLVTLPRVSRSRENFPDEFDLHLQQVPYKVMERC